jgi:dolichol-phosphate mannosyltransferase
MKTLSIVTPVYNEIDSIAEFATRIKSTMAPWSDKVDWELLFCVDPSTDGTEELIESLHNREPRFKMVRFSRRFGQPIATMAGIELSNGDAVAVIDADLQDPPEVISDLIREWLNGSKIVLAKRRSRTGEPAIKKFVAKTGYSFLNKFAEVPIPENTGDFRLMDRQVVNELLKYRETNSFLRGLVSLVGFPVKTIEFDRPERFAGTTKYNAWFGSLKIGFNGVVGFSSSLLSLSTILGFASSILSLLIGAGYGLAKIAGFDFPIGNPTIVICVLFMGGMNLLTMGILGLYVGRIYDEVKRRPKYIVEYKIGL